MNKYNKEKHGFCKNCPKRDTCKKICKELENYLRKKDKDRLYSDRTIRRREIPYNPDMMDEFLMKELLEKKYGRRKNTKDNWE